MPIKKKTTKAPAKKATALGPKAKLMKLQVTTLRNKAKKLGISNVTTRTKENLAQSIILAEARKKRGTAAGKKATAKRKAPARSSNPNRQINVPPKGSDRYWADASKKAKAPGRRTSKSGKVYYERRANRSDVPGTFAGSKKHMGTVYESDISRMGKREIDMLISLLTKYVYGNVTPVFDALWDDDGVGFGYNDKYGTVWLQNSDYMTAMDNDGELDIFINTPYSGHEGFLDELAQEKDTASWDDEDAAYLYEIYNQLPPSPYKTRISRYFE